MNENMKFNRALCRAYDKCFDAINLSGEGEGVDIYYYMNKYKAIRELEDKMYDYVYDCLVEQLGFTK